MNPAEKLLAGTIDAIRRESGQESGCPLCGGDFEPDTGVCNDCGMDILYLVHAPAEN